MAPKRWALYICSMRMLSLLTAAVLALGTVACNKNPGCPVSTTTLADWPRKDAQFAPVSFIVPPGAFVNTLPVANHAPGEAWSGRWLDMYYRFDSVMVDRQADTNNLTENVVICNDTLSGHPVKLTVLFSKANNMPGEFGHATWRLPNGRGFYMAVLAPQHSARDTILAVLRSVQFKK
jgi:hypothetical protein